MQKQSTKKNSLPLLLLTFYFPLHSIQFRHLLVHTLSLIFILPNSSAPLLLEPLPSTKPSTTDWRKCKSQCTGRFLATLTPPIKKQYILNLTTLQGRFKIDLARFPTLLISRRHQDLLPPSLPPPSDSFDTKYQGQYQANTKARA